MVRPGMWRLQIEIVLPAARVLDGGEGKDAHDIGVHCTHIQRPAMDFRSLARPRRVLHMNHDRAFEPFAIRSQHNPDTLQSIVPRGEGLSDGMAWKKLTGRNLSESLRSLHEDMARCATKLKHVGTAAMKDPVVEYIPRAGRH